MKRAEEGQGMGTDSGKFGTKNLEAENIGSKAERTGGCAKLNKLTEIGRSGACNTFIAKRVCFVLIFFFFF